MDRQTDTNCCLSQLWLGSSSLGLFLGKWAHATGVTRVAAPSRPEAGVPHCSLTLLLTLFKHFMGMKYEGLCKGQRIKRNHRATKCLPTSECRPKCVPHPLWNVTSLAKERGSGISWGPYSLGLEPATKG